ncbi:MAG: helix-turn-helix transcriptional regulator [Moorellaceae bacterium]
MPGELYTVSSSPLSPQQQQIWDLYQKGYGAKRIAKELGLRVEDVKKQLKRAKNKLGYTEGEDKNCGQKSLGVSRAHEGLEEILESLRDTSSQIDFLRENGYKPSAIANTLGVNIRKVYNRNRESKRSSLKRSFMSREELRSLPSQKEALDLDIARVIYEVFVNNDNPGHDTLAMLGTQGFGGWRAKRVVLTRRAGVLKALAVAGRENGRVVKISDKESPWWEMIKDLVERYKLVGADTYLPDSLKAFASELQDRIEAALDGVRIEVKENREGTKVYEVVGGFTAVAIRPLVNQAAIIVSANLYGTKLGAKQYEGTVTFDESGLKVSGQAVENFGGIIFRNGEKRWFTIETKLLRAGDKVRVRLDLYGFQVLEVLSWKEDTPLPTVICLEGEDLALAVAAYKIKEDCFIEIAGRVFDCRKTAGTRRAI